MGGQGSGYFQHAGRPGEIGGSTSGGRGGGKKPSSSKARERSLEHQEQREVQDALPPPVQESIKKLGDTIRHNDAETLIVIDAKTGKELARVQGTHDEAGEISDATAAKMTGNIEIHNHPDLPGDKDVPLSWPDLQGFLEGDSRQIIAVTPGYNFSFALPPRGLSPKERKTILRKARSIIPKGRHPVVTHDMWTKLAGQTRLRYIRTEA